MSKTENTSTSSPTITSTSSPTILQSIVITNTSTLSNADENQYSNDVQEEIEVDNTFAESTGEQAMDLNTEATVRDDLVPEVMETVVIGADGEDATDEKTSYEIAVEALCLMKSGGVIIANEGDVGGENGQAEAFYGNPGNILVQRELANAVDMQNLISRTENIVTQQNNHQGSSSALPTSEKPLKYVIVPESALLSTVKPGEIVSVPGTPYYLMMPKEKQPATRVLTMPGLPDLFQGPQKYNAKTGSRAAVVTTMPLNLSKSVPAQSDKANSKSSASKRSGMKKHDTLKFPPCVICEGEASGYHYGCNTCEACKNFFRRCLLRKTETPSFVCHCGNTCEISFKKNKNNCSACRLHKCLEMGMAKDKCKMGRYTASMRTETIKKVRKLEGKDENISDTSSVNSPCPSSSQQLDETIQQAEASSQMDCSKKRDIYGAMISKQIFSSENDIPETRHQTDYNDELVDFLVSAMDKIKPWGENLVTEESRKTLIKKHYEKYQAKVETFGSLSDVPMQEYQELLKKFGIDIDGQWETFKQWTFDLETVIGRYCAFAKCIPEFRSLSFDDQACLLKATHFDFFAIVLHQGYIPEYGVFLELNGVPYHIEEAANKFFSRNLVICMVDIMSRLQKMDLSKSEMALLTSIVTMSCDQCKLENPKLVEETQLRLVDLLQRESSKIHSQAVGRRRFTCLIDIITKMREVSNIYYKEYQALCNDDLIKETVPNFDCILPENC